MSDENSDAHIAVPSVSAQDSIDQSTDAPALSELSERDKPWDKHKHNSDRVSNHYAKSEYHEYSRSRVRFKMLLDGGTLALSTESRQDEIT